MTIFYAFAQASKPLSWRECREFSVAMKQNEQGDPKIGPPCGKTLPNSV